MAKTCFLAFLTFLACLLPCHARGGEIGFALIGTESSNTLLSIWNPLLADMSEATGLTVKPLAFPDYSGAVWALKTRKAQLAWLGNKAAIVAVDQAQCEVAFIGVEEGGKTGYSAQLITRADSSLTNVEDVLKNASSITFGLGDPNSTSGYVVPSYYIFSHHQIDPGKAFKRLIRGSHEENFLAVVQGRADVAANNSFDMKRMETKHPGMFSQVRVIWNSPLIPSDPIVWRTDLPDGDKSAIRAFLLGYGQDRPGKNPQRLEHERAVLQDVGRQAFRESGNSQLLPLRRLELFTLKERALGDPKLGEEARKEKILEIDQSLAALEAAEKATGP